jgi:hypothetical protein
MVINNYFNVGFNFLGVLSKIESQAFVLDYKNYYEKVGVICEIYLI